MKPGQLLAQALEKAQKVSDKGILKSAWLERTERERLLKSGFLQEIVKGWYLLTGSGGNEHGNTLWYGSFWEFLRVYLTDRFGQDYCLSAECSLDLWAQAQRVPDQVVVMTSKGTTYTLNLPCNTSVLVYQEKNNMPKNIVELRGLRVMDKGIALVRASPSYYHLSALNIEVILRGSQISQISRELLKGEHIAAAGRIAAAYQQYGLESQSQEIIETMHAAGLTVKKDETVAQEVFLASGKSVRAPYLGRFEALWGQLKKQIQQGKKPPKAGRIAQKRYWGLLEEEYVNDAYNSLSIEGYEVSAELIEQVRSGQWELTGADLSGQRDALAAKGYQEAFESVKTSIEAVFSGMDAGDVIERDLQRWYRNLFGTSVRAGIIDSQRLAGYRDHPVFINKSRHVPPRKELVGQLMDLYFELLKKEEDVWARVVLGHFMFVYIHPYMDGNGRLGRFIMNVLLAQGGYDWVVVPVARRREYMESLEKASVEHNISDFNDFLLSQVK